VPSSPDVVASASAVKAIYFLSFLTGGAAYGVGFGLLAAGISVTSYFSRHLPTRIAPRARQRLCSYTQESECSKNEGRRRSILRS
jgi:hypothetical protein